MENSRPVYHYTTGKRLAQIVRSGRILTSPSFSRALEKPAVWCSVTKDWEPSAAMMYQRPDGSVIRRTRAQIQDVEEGLIRIRIGEAAGIFTFEQYKRISRISQRHLKMLSKFAADCGADLRLWRVVLQPVIREHWISVEIYDRHAASWQTYTGDTGQKKELAGLLGEIRDCLPLMGKDAWNRLSSKLDDLTEEMDAGEKIRLQNSAQP